MLKRKPKTKADFFKLEQQVWDELNALVADLSDEDWLKPGAIGTWCIRDVWVHLAGWMKYTPRVIPKFLALKPVRVDIQERNTQQVARAQKLSPAAARRRIETARTNFLTFIQTVREDDLLNNSHVYSWASFTTYNHYVEHIPELKHFRRTLKQQKRLSR
jgi:hypothetical protein